ncbi:MAG: Glu-tRNA(Gln) amidotransferase subunit GatE [Methanomicrobiaceae archaeon]|nr:Glu-tRNA(Gln) amidotransferase subunit GatE [Methanomicrobiaceae archaeon]
MDYDALGLKAGIEIHQQLDTRHKLFCKCPTILRDTDERNGEFFRYLRATESELGEIDRAAEEEMRVERKFTYYAYDTTCLVEDDEEPPAPLNMEALEISLTIAKMMKMCPVPQVHVMRKLVIDGSNTSGFQRTALVALNGLTPLGATIETIGLEEEAAQRVEGDTFSLDRLGIPLVEIATGPDMHSPEAVREVAEYIGMVLRSTGKVKRGIGTIRQDINISVRDGARVEIKGVQELDLVEEVVRREVQRQVALLSIRAELGSRNAAVNTELWDVTGEFGNTRSSILKSAPVVYAVLLEGFAGLVGKELQPGRRLGSEMADYARKCGVGGIFHSDELPAYGISEEEVARVRERTCAGEADAVVLVAGPERRARCAAGQVIRRALLAQEGVLEETRKMLKDGSTAYMRPLPGAARMYPETDVLPLEVSPEAWEALGTPELLSEKIERFRDAYGFDPFLSKQVAYSELLPLFEQAVAAGVRPMLAARTITGTLRELSREGVPVDAVQEQDLLLLLGRVEAGAVTREAMPDVLRAVAEGMAVEDAVSAVAPPLDEEELRASIRRILTEREAFIREKGMQALGPLMGVVMKDVRGRVDGRIIAELVREELQKMLE